MYKNRNRGFTLIEIMLVVTIIGILAAVVLPRLVGRSEEARVSAAKLQIENIGLALDAFELDTGKFPTTDEGIKSLRENVSNIKNWKGPYLKKNIVNDPWGNPYVYKSPGTNNPDYDLESYGPDGVDGGGDDVENWESGK